MKLIDQRIWTNAQEHPDPGHVGPGRYLEPLFRWFTRSDSFGPRPDGNLDPQKAADWDRNWFGAQQCYVWLGLSYHEGNLPFRKKGD